MKSNFMLLCFLGPNVANYWKNLKSLVRQANLITDQNFIALNLSLLSLSHGYETDPTCTTLKNKQYRFNR